MRNVQEMELTVELFQSAFDFAAIGMAVVALDGRWLKVNQAFCEMTGYTGAELLSLHFQSITHPEDELVGKELIAQARAGELASFRLEKRYVHRQGHIIWVQVNVTALHDKQGQLQCFFTQVQDITGLKRMEQHYASLIEYNPAGICSFDRSGRINGINPAMEAITGFSKEELLGKLFQSLLTEEHSFCTEEQGSGGKMAGNCEIAILGKQGNRVELGLKEVPIIIDGRTEGSYLIARDITRDKLTEKALLTMQQQFQEVVCKQQGMTFKFVKRDGRFIHTLCGGELMHKLGQTAEKVVGKELKDIVPYEMALEKEKYYQRAWDGHEEVLYEGTLNGVTYLTSLRPILRGGSVVEVIASCIDITERKRAEDSLKETKELLESYVNNTSDAIIVNDVDGRVLQVNTAFENMYGWKQSDIAGALLPLYPEELRLEYTEMIDRVLANEAITDYDTLHIRSDGSAIPVSLTISPIKDAKGRMIAYAATSRDRTERKRAEELLRKSDKLAVAGQLAAGLAHEIRNPLTSLKGFLQLMKSLGNTKREYFDIMLSELDRINFIVSEFLVIAKPEVIKYESRDIPTIMHTVLKLIEPEAHLKNVSLKVAIEEPLPYVLCSEVQIKQVLINLLKNAMEAMPSGGEVTIEAIQGTSEVVLRVCDGGVGIPAERLKLLGEPFYTTKEKGTGLGLMMCFKIIEAHEGSIRIHSVPDEGTEVEIKLPFENKRGM
jgi:two-component system, sporulation sensor kinase A